MAAQQVAVAACLGADRVIQLAPSAFDSIKDVETQIASATSSDPGRSLASSSANSTALLTPAHKTPLARLSAHMDSFKASSSVIHVAATAAEHVPLATSFLKSAGTVLLFSGSASQARVHAVLAAKLARSIQRAVAHIFVDDGSSSSSVAEEWSADQWQTAASFMQEGNDAGHLVVSDQDAEDVVTRMSNMFPAQLGGALPLAQYAGPATAEAVAIAVSPASSLQALTSNLPSHTGLLSLSLLAPLTPARLLSLVPATVQSVVVLEPASSFDSPLFLDVAAIFNDAEDRPLPNIVSRKLGAVTASNASAAGQAIAAALQADAPEQAETIGDASASSSSSYAVPAASIPKHEESYTKILDTLFAERLDIANKPQEASSSALPSMGLGKALASQEQQKALQSAVRRALSDGSVANGDLKSALTAWLDAPHNAAAGERVQSLIKGGAQLPASVSNQAAASFACPSTWIIGSDAWAYDLGTSAVHHALSSGANVNLLVVDSQPYAGPDSAADPEKRAKKDIGLYAMNYGNAYVASVAVYSDYSQVVRAFAEADSFQGPSVVVAYLPEGHQDTVRALDILKETKRAVDAGFWPLYRWNPTREVQRVPDEFSPKAGGRAWNSADVSDAFQLDSERIKGDLRDFLDRQNHLTQLSRNEPVMSQHITSGLGNKMREAAENKARSAYELLSGAVDGPSLLVLFASDGGNAEKVAKRFTARARARGLGARVQVMDEFSPEDLALEPNVALITSVAGQGEFPQNGRAFWKTLASHSAALGPSGGDGKNFDQMAFSVFGMGDSHYWPRPEDAGYYNKAGRDLHKKLTELGAQEFAPLGLGDDQDPDGYQTAYKMWEAEVWKALGVSEVEVKEAEPEPITNEHIKIASNYLRGTIAEGLVDTSTGALPDSDGQLTKFHGIYQQDDRDIREQRKSEGLEPAYSFMVRVRMPAGVCQPEQWAAIDDISDARGNHTFKLTTRQTFQFHGIVKSHLKPAIQEINKSLLDTIAACGDVNRNVMCGANPSIGPLHAQVHEFSKNVSEHLMPMTSAYAEIWLDKKLVAGDAVKSHTEPLYGPYYLPRKFKIAVAVPPNNDVDVYCNDVGFIAIVGKDGNLEGFNVSIGGGMGVTHAMKSTYPRLGDVIGFVKPEYGVLIAEKIMLVQRDNGNRANRKNARLKYTIDRMGLDNFVAEVEKLLGFKIEPAREFKFDSNIDEFGWAQGADGKWHCTVFIENGRVEDAPGKPFKTGLREISKVLKGVFRLTGNQHLIISDISAEDKPQIESLLAQYKLDKFNHTGLRLSSSACVAMPTCGLAMAESERFLPGLIDRVEKIMEDEGLRHDSIVMRVTGCPNGCARPYAAEVGFVGKAPNSYLMLLGGGYYGQRLNKIYKESVSEEEIVATLTPMIRAYAKQRLDGEPFGDFTIRMGWIKPTTAGKLWYENMLEGKAVEA